MNKICINGFIPAKDARHAGTFSNVRKIAFTLAEVLVTLGIIGVVSAMTVPSLMQNHQRKTYVTQLHKVYNEMQQAFLQYMTDKNAIDLREAGLTSVEETQNFMKKYLKVVSDCGQDLKEPCFSETYKNMNGAAVTLGRGWDGASVVLASGASVFIDYASKYNGTVNDKTYYYGAFVVDVNGLKGPNIVGRDLFRMYYFMDGTVDEVSGNPYCRKEGLCNGSDLKTLRENKFNASCASGTDGIGCFGKILNDNWEMTY